MEIKDEVGEEYGKKYKGKYVYRSISWGKQNTLTEQCTRYSPGGQSRIDMKLLQAKLVMATLREAPKAITLSHLVDESDNGLPAGLGSRMMQIVDKVNNIQPEEVKNSDEP